MPPKSIPPTNNSVSNGPQYQSLPPQPSPYAATAANPASIPPNQMFSTTGGGGSIPPNTYQAPPGTGSIPPNSYQAPPGTGSIPPTSRGPTGPVSSQVSPGTVQRRASAPQRAPSPQPSLSMPKKRGTRWGIALFILAIDLGLAATGAYLLQAGL